MGLHNSAISLISDNSASLFAVLWTVFSKMNAMHMIIVAALIGCAFAFDDACDKKQPPAFCQGLDCPRYKLLCCNATALIDTRAYQEALWARTEIVGGTIAQA